MDGDVLTAECGIFFETDDDRKCKMFRKRIDLLEPLAQELNPQAFDRPPLLWLSQLALCSRLDKA